MRKVVVLLFHLRILSHPHSIGSGMPPAERALDADILRLLVYFSGVGFSRSKPTHKRYAAVGLLVSTTTIRITFVDVLCMPLHQKNRRGIRHYRIKVKLLSFRTS